jgi:hypothetical protein
MRLSHLFGNNAAAHPALPGATPLASGPFGGAVSSPGAAYPRGTGLPGLQRLLGVQSFRNAQRANPLLWSSLDQLINQGNTNQFDGEDRANYLAPRLQALDSAKTAAQGQLTQDLASRGLGDSSAMAAGLGQIDYGAGQGAEPAAWGAGPGTQPVDGAALGSAGDGAERLVAAPEPEFATRRVQPPGAI